MNCPKCGFEQPDAHECLKCGVVIAKYISLLRRREDLDNKPLSATPATVMDYPPAESASADLKDFKEENSRIWGELQYVKADTNLLTETMRGLQKRHDDLARAIGQCANQADVKKMSQDLADVSHVLGAMHTTVSDLAGLFENLSAIAASYPALSQEVDRVKADLGRHEIEHQHLANEVSELRRAAPQWQTTVEELRARVQELSAPEWNQVREQLHVELQRLLASDGHEWLSRLESAFRTEMAAIHTRFEALEPRLAEMDSLKESLTGLSAQLHRLEMSPSVHTHAELAALRERVDTLAPRVSELDLIKESLAELAVRLDQPPSPSVDLTALMPRVETLEGFHQNVTKTLEKLAGAGSPETQLEALKQWADRVQSSPPPKADSDAGVDLRELKDDIKLIKVLVSDLAKRTVK